MKEQQSYIKLDDSIIGKDGITNRWYNHCMQEGIPYILVKVNGKKANIECDFMTLESAMDDVLQQNHQQIKSQVIQMLELYAHGSRASYSISWSAINLEGIPMRSAEFIAESIFKLIMRFLGAIKVARI